MSKDDKNPSPDVREFEPENLGILDDLSAPQILVDGVAGAMLSGGVATINCISTVLQVEPSGDMMQSRKVVLRLSIPFGALEEVANSLSRQAHILAHETNEAGDAP